MNETRQMSFAGSDFLAVLTHAHAVQMVRDAGCDLPAFLPGFNTISMYFKTTEGLQAIAINQTGFAPVQSDDEREVNGCTVLVCLDIKLDWLRARYLLKALKNDLIHGKP